MKARPLLLLFLLLAGPMSAARAGASLAEIERSARESEAKAANDRQNAGRVLRCWQNGRLLFESSGFTQMTENSPSVVISRQDGGEPTTVFNFQDGLCILSDR